MKPKPLIRWPLFLRGWLLLFLLGLAGTAAATPPTQSEDPASLPRRNPSPSPEHSSPKSAVPASGTPPAKKVRSPTTPKMISGWRRGSYPPVTTNTKPLLMAPGKTITASTPNITAPTSPWNWPKIPPSPSGTTTKPVGLATASTVCLSSWLVTSNQS